MLPVHDAAGNMTKCPKPKVANEAADETSRLHLVYDAWNRLTRVYDDNGSGAQGAQRAGQQEVRPDRCQWRRGFGRRRPKERKSHETCG